MSTKKVVGGVLAAVGGSLILITCVLRMGVFALGSNYQTAWIINLLIAVVALGGDIVGIRGKRLGGILVLITGIVSILLATLFATQSYLSPEKWLSEQYSLIPYLLGGTVAYASIEALLLVLGGILILVSGEEY